MHNSYETPSQLAQDLQLMMKYSEKEILALFLPFFSNISVFLGQKLIEFSEIPGE